MSAQDQDFEDTFIDDNEVGEVMEDSNVQFEEEDGEDDAQEVELRNNSYSYFDQHQDSIFLIASHPTLPMVLTGGGDEKAFLWTTHSTPAKLVTELSGQQESVVAGGFTADGKNVVTGDMKGQLRVWRAKAGGERWEFITSIQEVEEIVYIKFHHTLPLIAVGAIDGSVWIYDLGQKVTQLGVLNGHAAAATTAIFVDDEQDPDAVRLITLSEDAQILCWNVYTSQTIYTLGRRELRGEHPWVSVVASPSGKTIAVGSMDGYIGILKVENGQLLHFMPVFNDKSDLEGRSIEGLSWSDKTGLLACGSVDGQVQLFSPANWKCRVNFSTEESVTKLEFVKGEPFLIVSSMDEQVAVYDALNGSLVWRSYGHGAGVLGFVQQEGGHRLITADDAGVALVFQIDQEAAAAEAQLKALERA